MNYSGIMTLNEFVRKLLLYLHGITASANYPLNIRTLERISHKIKVAFPGKPRLTKKKPNSRLGEGTEVLVKFQLAVHGKIGVSPWT